MTETPQEENTSIQAGIPVLKNKTIGGKVKTSFLVPVLSVEHGLIKDVNDPLFDPRASWTIHKPTKDSIKRYGIQDPIRVVKRGKVELDGVELDTIAIFDGNQRVINGCQAQRELIEEHGEQAPIIKVEVRVFQGNDADVLARKGTSFIRRNNDVLSEAILIKKHFELCQDYDDVATAFGCSTKHVKRQLGLASTPKEVQNAIHDGKMSATEAREEYVEMGSQQALLKLDENKIDERKSVNDTSSRVRRRSKAEGATKAPNKATIKRLISSMVQWSRDQQSLNNKANEMWTDSLIFCWDDIKAFMGYIGGEITLEQARDVSPMFADMSAGMDKKSKKAKKSKD